MPTQRENNTDKDQNNSRLVCYNNQSQRTQGVAEENSMHTVYPQHPSFLDGELTHRHRTERKQLLPNAQSAQQANPNEFSM